MTNYDAAHAASDVIADVVNDAVANLIKEAPQELTGECNVWKICRFSCRKIVKNRKEIYVVF